MDVPTGLGFTCCEGTSLGCASPAGCEDSNFTCTVVPDAGMSDVTSTNVVCSIESGAQSFVPDSASPMCPGQHQQPLQQRQPVLEHGPDLRHNHQHHHRCVDVGCKHGGGRICCGGPGNGTAALGARISFSQCLYHSTAQRLFLIVRASSSRCDRNLARAVLTDLSQTLVCWPGLRQREVNLAVIDGFLGEATSRQPAQSSASKKVKVALIHEARFPIGGLLVGCPTGFCGSRRGGMCPTRAFSTRRAPRPAPNTYRVSADHGTDVRPQGGLPYSVGGGWTSRFATPRCDAAHLRSAPSSSWLEEVSQGHRGASITQEWRIVEVHGRELNAAPEADRSCACHPYGGSVTLVPYLCRKMR
ncbi:hypothetical protein AK812_SmicGene8974 [Symbiodinium microadriaticum]|uniref:Uncharacterized protein n=1 Tax=Symbiodinium microadriaticum TaxID=2951 RepID=A0A1Q9EJN3_SYMMI|nr:hypothetical protein AK812_SmicGene8974 [Symbiodinium microadriaticum]